MKINRKLILGVVLLLLVALILYFINRRKRREGFYVDSGNGGISLTGDSFGKLLTAKGSPGSEDGEYFIDTIRWALKYFINECKDNILSMPQTDTLLLIY